MIYKSIILFLSFCLFSCASTESSEKKVTDQICIVTENNCEPIEGFDKYRPISRSQPLYPKRALKDKIMGRVTLEFNIGVDGKPKDIKVVESTNTQFTKSAIDALNTFVYRTIEFEGEKVELRGKRHNFTYKIEGNRHWATDTMQRILKSPPKRIR